MGLERAHAEFLGQGEGLVVVGFGLLALRGLAPRGNIAEEAQGIRLVTAFLVLRVCSRACSARVLRLLQAAGQQLRLAQVREQQSAWRLSLPFVGGLFQHPFEQRHGLGDAPGQRIRRAQGRRQLGKKNGRSAS